MNELFRYLMLRPAQAASPADADGLSESTIVKNAVAGRGDVLAVAEAAAKEFANSDQLLRDPSTLTLSKLAGAVADAVAAGPVSRQDVESLSGSLTDRALESLVDDEAFRSERKRLADTLASMKLLSSSLDLDAPELVRLETGYDVLARAAGGEATLARRVVALPPALSRMAAPLSNPPSPPAPPAQPPSDDLREFRARIERLDTAIAELSRLSARDFAKPVRQEARVEVPAVATPAAAPAGNAALRVAARRSPRAVSPPVMGVASVGQKVAQPWLLETRAQQALSAPVRGLLDGLGVSAQNTGLPRMLTALHDEKMRTLSGDGALLLGASLIKTSASQIGRLGTSFVHSNESDLVGKPAAPLPTGRGKVKPVGVGDLLLVKQHVLRYEGGEVAHVENVLRTEKLSRETRRLERTEQTTATDRESLKEEQRDTQTTERFSLARETADTIKRDSEFKAGVQVSASYGPFIEVKANAGYASSSASQSSSRQATDFSKDVVARSVSRIVERIHEYRSTTSLLEFEERYAHGFDNTTGGGHVAGVYQWVDKVLQAQVYNYGKRLLFDVILPEPSTAYVVAQARNSAEGSKLIKPEPFELPASAITEANYQTLALAYEVTGLEPPPAPWRMIAKSWENVNPNAPHESAKAEILPIDEGYQAKYVLSQWNYSVYPGASLVIMVGTTFDSLSDAAGYRDLNEEVNGLPISLLAAYGVRSYAVNFEIFCERTPRAFTQWQLKTHAAILQGSIAKRAAYERALAEARAAAGVAIQGRNPLYNERIVETEMQKQALSLLTGQHFDGFGALELSGEGYPQPALARAEQQSPYIRFFEQAFEWEHQIYFFYPYFWGLKKAWGRRALLDDVDPLFADFLRAGAARLVFPVRPGFEAAVVHYLETGEIWNGGVPPDITSSQYVPIIKEIQEAQGAPQGEVPVGEPWLVRLPTTLVKLRANDDLPKWKKVGEDWQPDE